MKGLLTIIAILVAGAVCGQQEWVYSLQALNLYDGNAAAAGMYERSAVNLRFRSQFSGVDGSPQTALLSWNAGFGKLGVGVRVQGEEIGIFRRTAGVVHASYTLQLNEGELRFGLGGGVTAQSLSGATLAQEGGLEDPALVGFDNRPFPLLQAAVLYRNQRFFAGLEANHLLASDTPNDWNNAPEALLMAGSQHKLNKDWSLRPLLAVRWSRPDILLPEAQAGVWWKKMLWFGAGYRWDAEMYGFVEYRLKGRLRIAYSYGAPVATTGLGANHEVMLGFIAPGKRRSIQNIRYFQ